MNIIPKGLTSHLCRDLVIVMVTKSTCDCWHEKVSMNYISYTLSILAAYFGDSILASCVLCLFAQQNKYEDGEEGTWGSTEVWIPVVSKQRKLVSKWQMAPSTINISPGTQPCLVMSARWLASSGVTPGDGGGEKVALKHILTSSNTDDDRAKSAATSGPSASLLNWFNGY